VQPHDVLGVRRGASRREVAEAYRRYALLHHPDRGGDESAFEAGADAYRRLRGGLPSAGPVIRAPSHADVVFHRRRRLALSSLLRRAGRRRSAARSLS
jgi:hypothetical protein